MTEQVLDAVSKTPGAALGGPDAPDPALCSAAAILALADAAGEGMRMTSLALDVASHAIGEGMVEIVTRIDKRAKSIVFASVQARIGAAMVFSAQGLFSRER